MTKEQAQIATHFFEDHPDKETCYLAGTVPFVAETYATSFAEGKAVTTVLKSAVIKKSASAENKD